MPSRRSVPGIFPVCWVSPRSRGCRRRSGRRSRASGRRRRAGVAARAEQAGGLEELAGLEARTARGRRRSGVSGSASAAAASPRRARGKGGVGQRHDRATLGGRRQHGERTREQVVARRLRRVGAETDHAAGSPRRSRAPSTRSSCTSVAMWTSSIATPAATDGSRRARERKQSSGRAACRRPRAPRRATSCDETRARRDSLGEPRLDLGHVPRQPRGGVTCASCSLARPPCAARRSSRRAAGSAPRRTRRAQQRGELLGGREAASPIRR